MSFENTKLSRKIKTVINHWTKYHDPLEVF